MISIYFSDLTYEKQQDILEQLIAQEKEKLMDDAKENLATYPKYNGWELDEILKDLYSFDTIREDWPTEKKYKEMLMHDIDSFAEELAEKRAGKFYMYIDIDHL